MSRKPIGRLSTQAALKPLMAQAFVAPIGIPDAMRAVLAQLGAGLDRSRADRFQAMVVLQDYEARDAQVATSPKI